MPRRPKLPPMMRYGAHILGPDKGYRYVAPDRPTALSARVRMVWVFARQDGPEVQVTTRKLSEALWRANGWADKAPVDTLSLTPIEAPRPPKVNPSDGRLAKRGRGGSERDWALWRARSLGIVPHDFNPEVRIHGDTIRAIASFFNEGMCFGSVDIPPHCRTVADTKTWHEEHQRRGGACLTWTLLPEHEAA